MVQSSSKYLHVNDDQVERVYVRMPQYIRRRQQALHQLASHSGRPDLVHCSDSKTLPQPRAVTIVPQKSSSVTKSSTQSQLLSSSKTKTTPSSQPKAEEQKCLNDPPPQPVCCEPEPPVCCPPPPQPACCPQPQSVLTNKALPLYAAEDCYHAECFQQNVCDCNCMNSAVATRQCRTNARQSIMYPPTQIVDRRYEDHYAEPLSNVYEQPVNYCYVNRSHIYVPPQPVHQQCCPNQNSVARLRSAYSSSPRYRQKKTTSCC